MTTKNVHWTEKSVTAFRYRIAADFATQIEKRMKKMKLKRKGMASRLSVSVARVSQVLNDPGNLSLDLIIRYARALGMKVAVVAYDDNDPTNKDGPINPEVFQVCWERVGCPRDFFDLKIQTQEATTTSQTYLEDDRLSLDVNLLRDTSETSGDTPLPPFSLAALWRMHTAATRGELTRH